MGEESGRITLTLQNMTDTKNIQNHAHYTISSLDNGQMLLFVWKQIADLSLENFKAGVASFANQCKKHRPKRIVFDARMLASHLDLIGWISGRKKIDNEETYSSWWLQNIVPSYHEVGILSLAVATGDPSAPGELPNKPEGVNFKVGYFPDLESALAWELK